MSSIQRARRWYVQAPFRPQCHIQAHWPRRSTLLPPHKSRSHKIHRRRWRCCRSCRRWRRRNQPLRRVTHAIAVGILKACAVAIQSEFRKNTEPIVLGGRWVMVHAGQGQRTTQTRHKIARAIVVGGLQGRSCKPHRLCSPASNNFQIHTCHRPRCIGVEVAGGLGWCILRNRKCSCCHLGWRLSCNCTPPHPCIPTFRTRRRCRLHRCR